MEFINQLKRRPLAIFVDACIVINAYAVASLVLFASTAPLPYYDQILVFLPMAIFVHCLVYMKAGLYRTVGRYVGLDHALKAVKATIVSTAILLGLGTVTLDANFRLQIIIIVPLADFMVLTLITGVRFYPRIFYERSLRELKSGMNLLIVGAGAAGEMILKSIKQEPQSLLTPAAFADDNLELRGMEIHGVPICGTTENIPELVADKDIDEILIAIPSANQEQFKRIWDICSSTRALTKTLGTLQNPNLGRVGINSIREVKIEDFLGRPPVKTDYFQIMNFIRNKTVLITGAGGSIGSELAIQISHHRPSKIVLLDRDESAIYEIHEKLSQRLFFDYQVHMADVRSSAAMDVVFSQYRPDLVFHAAAYKHVPIMEMQPDEAVLNNIKGAYNVAQKAGEYGASCFINMSTDKAVDPFNAMGVTKHISERLTRALGFEYENTRYCSVRFGNVLGSRGSVIPIFQKQIERGGPLTLTHPDMTRYFMLISEAVDLVLQAAAFSDGNAIYILEMGKPVRIMDLARQMIDFMKPGSSIEINVTGVRPGEKLHEKLIDAEETAEATAHSMIYRVTNSPWRDEAVLDILPAMFNLAENREIGALKAMLSEFAVTYRPLDAAQAESHEPGFSPTPKAPF